MKTQTNDTHENNISYSPAAILNSFSNSLTSPLLNKQFSIKGIYRRGKGVNYNGVYYDILRDQNTDANLTIVTPENIRHLLNEGQIIEATAYATKRLSVATGRIDLILNVSEIISQEKKGINQDELKLLEIIKEKASLGYKDVDSVIKQKILLSDEIRVVILIGLTAIIDVDIKHQLKDSSRIFNISYIRVNLTRPDEIIKAVQQYDGCDLLVIARGGGEKIEVFNNTQLCEYCLRLKSPLITAIGHAADEPFLQKIADKHFITPTALGQYLHDSYEKVSEELNESKTKLIEDISKQFELQYQSKIQDLSSRLIEAVKTINAVEKVNDNQIKLVNERLSKAKSTNAVLLTILVILTLIFIVFLFVRH